MHGKALETEKKKNAARKKKTERTRNRRFFPFLDLVDKPSSWKHSVELTCR